MSRDYAQLYIDGMRKALRELFWIMNREYYGRMFL